MYVQPALKHPGNSVFLYTYRVTGVAMPAYVLRAVSGALHTCAEHHIDVSCLRTAVHIAQGWHTSANRQSLHNRHAAVPTAPQRQQ